MTQASEGGGGRFDVRLIAPKDVFAEEVERPCLRGDVRQTRSRPSACASNITVDVDVKAVALQPRGARLRSRAPAC